MTSHEGSGSLSALRSWFMGTKTRDCDCPRIGLLKGFKWSWLYAWRAGYGRSKLPVVRGFGRRLSFKMLGYAEHNGCPFCIRFWTAIHNIYVRRDR